MGTISESSARATDAARIEDWLVALPLPRLRALATARQLDARGAARHDLIQRLAADMGNPQATERILEACMPKASALLEYALLWDGEVPLDILIPASERLAMSAVTASHTAASMIDELAERGLLLIEPRPSAPTLHTQRDMLAADPRTQGGIVGTSSSRVAEGLPGSRVYVPYAVRSLIKQTIARADAPSAHMPHESVPMAPVPALLPLVERCWAELHAGHLAPLVARRTHPIEAYSPALQGWQNVFDEIERLAGRGTGHWHTIDPMVILSVAQPPVGLAQEDRRRLMEALQCSERQLAFAFRLLRATGLIATTASSLVTLPEEMASFLARPARDRLRLLTQAWLRDTHWSELFQVRDLVVSRYAGEIAYKQDMLMADLSRGRGLISRALGRLGPGWHSTASVVATLRHIEPDLPALCLPRENRMSQEKGSRRTAISSSSVAGAHGKIAEQDDNIRALRAAQRAPWVLRGGVQQRILRLDTEVDWTHAVGGFLTRILLGPLHWLGAVELALHPEYDHLPDHQAVMAFSLTDLGHYLLNIGATHDDGQGARVPARLTPLCPCLKLDQDLSIHPTDETPAAVHDLLARVGQRTVGEDIALHYALEPRHFTEGPNAQGRIQEVVSLLEQHGIPPVAPVVWATLHAWHERAGQVALYPRVSVLEVADVAALDEILATTSLRGALLCRLSEHSVMIESTAVDLLIEQMIEHGYTPRLWRHAQ